jgi:hypothetical protein
MKQIADDLQPGPAGANALLPSTGMTTNGRRMISPIKVRIIRSWNGEWADNSRVATPKIAKETSVPIIQRDARMMAGAAVVINQKISNWGGTP